MTKLKLFGKRLKQAREEKGYTQEMLGSMVGIGPDKPTISKYENGKHEPRALLILTFADILGVSADWLLGRTDKK